jgi:pimeloyl-ACP methyl ester carboxylesterase
MSWSFPYRGETEELDEITRSSAPGAFVRLQDGNTHYELGGPESGAPVVLVHGFSVPQFIWDPTFEHLTEEGFRVLRYDLFGRGFSDRPKVRYNIDLFCKQLRELLDTLEFSSPVRLFGLSMGGPLSASFAAQYPEEVEGLVLIDPAGACAVELPFGMKIGILPGIGELGFGLFGDETLVKGIADDFFGKDLVAQFQDKYRVQMKYKGFKRAILSTLRNGAVGDFSAAYRAIGEAGIPTLLIWGEQDQTLPLAHSEIIRELIPGIQFHPITNCGHVPHYEKPEEVNQIISRFLE